MPNTKRYTDGWDKIEDSMRAYFAQAVDDKMLDVLADQEVRICMLELGI